MRFVRLYCVIISQCTVQKKKKTKTLCTPLTEFTPAIRVPKGAQNVGMLDRTITEWEMCKITQHFHRHMCNLCFFILTAQC